MLDGRRIGARWMLDGCRMGAGQVPDRRRIGDEIVELKMNDDK